MLCAVAVAPILLPFSASLKTSSFLETEINLQLMVVVVDGNFTIQIYSTTC